MDIISDKNYTVKTSQEVHVGEIKLKTKSVLITKLTMLIKQYENFLCQTNEDDGAGLLKVSKMYFLRGRANVFVENFEEALNDFEQASNFNPKDKKILKQVKRTKASLKRREKNLASKMRKMFT